MADSDFVYGWELQGRGEPTTKDVIVGSFMFVVSLLAIIFGILNLYVIYKTPLFHNAFGWFWASRTCAELLSNFVSVICSAPLTILQLKPLPVSLGMLNFLIGGGGGWVACLMHQAISTNRLIAVYKPIQYKFIFSKKNSMKVVAACCIPVPILFCFHYVIPCNAIGFSPHLYEFIFVACEANFTRKFSIVGAVLDWFCMSLCVVTIATDCATLFKIVHLRQSQKHLKDDKNHCRDVRFFFQTAVQNVTMIVASVCIVVANYSHKDEHWRLLGYNAVHVTHLTNSLALILFNPEVRRRLCALGRVSEGESPVPTPPQRSSIH